jgi:hypothetical protein
LKHNMVIRGGHSISVRSLVIIGLRALGNRIFGEIDAFAWVQGWEIDRSRWFRRVYRDPRFDTLQECGLCQGEGRTEAAGGAGEMCGLCGGSGRIRRLKAGVRDEA